ncbi:uncharacterized protein LOC130734631 [Lotus japonicus]|uniref:uncharacterized protein LOC130734631 n=1 Tax=Lotus japonicus TaxID=34305 RepID=UPI002583788D|nr:uncharacterized protein LOC130734631 [Lotus japonicus]XP_057443120.1 uncharacterized protein LOC130734631 [Lotus japonicus]XP_057443122.1 uncharacterized protein LOC130734631 [Lotus japonicus]XP_057443123.1 uncharacterized protein LOC130734631 [Lotus japonicus]XP_057443124.1 uncharacterized protein LOC130734631 [Lotus japonicus]
MITVGCTEDLSTIASDVFTSTSLKKMGLVKTKVAPVHEDTSDEVRQRRVPLTDYPLWSQADDPIAILCYIDDLRKQGYEIDVDEFFRTLPPAPEFDSPPKKKTQRKIVLEESFEESDGQQKKKKADKSKRKHEEPTKPDVPSDGDDDDAPPPKKKKKQVRIVEKPTRVEPAAVVIRMETSARVTRSAVRSSSKYAVIDSDDYLNSLDALPISALLNRTATQLTHIPESQPADQTTSPPTSPRSSFFQPSQQEAPLWNMLQTPRPSEPTSPITIQYNPQTSEPIILEQSEPEPRPSDHSVPRASERPVCRTTDTDSTTLCPSVSFPINVADSSSSNNSEFVRKFVEIAKEKESAIPEYYQTVPSPRRYPVPRPDRLVDPDHPIPVVPLNEADPLAQSDQPEPENSVSNHSSVRSPHPQVETSEPNLETHTSNFQTLDVGSPQGASEANSSNHPTSPETNLSIVPYTYLKPNSVLECISVFNHEASLMIRNVQGHTDLSEDPDSVAEEWNRLSDWIVAQVPVMMSHLTAEKDQRIEATRQRFNIRVVLHEQQLRGKLLEAVEEARRKKEQAEEAARQEAERIANAKLEAERIEAEAEALRCQALAPVPFAHGDSQSTQASHPPQDVPSTSTQPSPSRLDILEQRLNSHETLLIDMNRALQELLRRTTKP